jgi:hypothetical protein
MQIVSCARYILEVATFSEDWSRIELFSDIREGQTEVD